jgi:hypothetical protein
LYPEAYHQGIDVYGQQLSKAEPTMSQQPLIITQAALVLAKQQESLTVVNQGSQSIAQHKQASNNNG